MSNNIDKILKWFTPLTVFCGLVLFFTGDHQKILGMAAIIEKYEQHGSPPVVVLQGDVKALQRRMDMVETIALRIPDLQIGLERLATKLETLDKKADTLHEELVKHTQKP